MEITEYFNLDEILKLDLNQEIKKNIEEKFGKTVFFDSNGSCKIGKLCGLSSEYYIIIDSDNKKMYIPTYQSITLL